MARNSTKRLGGEYDLEPRESSSSFHLSRCQHNYHGHLQMWSYAGFNEGDVLA